MEYYVPDYEIPILERQASLGDREAAERLIRSYGAEIASMTARRDKLVASVERMIEIRASVDEHLWSGQDT